MDYDEGLLVSLDDDDLLDQFLFWPLWLWSSLIFYSWLRCIELDPANCFLIVYACEVVLLNIEDLLLSLTIV